MSAPDGKAESDPGGHERATSDTGERLGRALLAYMLGVTLIITLLPFQFEWPREWRIIVAGDAFDILANVLLFVPLGYLYRLARPREVRGSALSVLVLAAVVSIAIEAMQLFEPTRETTVLDVVANTFGAWVGAVAFDRIARSVQVDGRLVGWLALELPLMGLAYLLVPLLWINSLASAGAWARFLPTLLIGAFGAAILGGIQRHYFGPAGAARPRHTALFAVIWFLAGAFAALPTRPGSLAMGALAVGALCWWQGGRSLNPTAANRRFEVPLLRAAAPLYAAYLAAIVVAPLVRSAGVWRFQLGFPEMASDPLEILRLLELGAASTLVGYMVAEIHGRELMSYRSALPRTILWGVLLATLIEAIRGYHAGYGASLARGGLLVGAILYGGWLYYLQRAHVVWLLSGNRARAHRAATMR